MNRGIATTFSNTVTGFDEGFSGLSNHIEQAGFDPRVVAERYPEDTGRMVSAYLDHPDRIDQADDPLLEAARLGGADGFRVDIFGGDESQEAPEPPPTPGLRNRARSYHRMTPAAMLSLASLALFSLADLRYRVAPGAAVFFLGAVLLAAPGDPLRGESGCRGGGVGIVWRWPSILIIPALFFPSTWAVSLTSVGVRRGVVGQADLLVLEGLACLFDWPATVCALAGVKVWRWYWRKWKFGPVPALPGILMGFVVYLVLRNDLW